jgi:hypothetical protein
MGRRYRPLFPNSSRKNVYLGDYLETAIFYSQSLIDKVLEDESIDKTDQPPMPYWTSSGVKLVPVECPDLSLNAVTLHTKVKFSREAVAKLWDPGDSLSGLQKKPVTYLIVEMIINFAITVLSLEEKYEVSCWHEGEFHKWGSPRFRCFVQDPWAREAACDVVLNDKCDSEVFGVETKSPRVGAGSQWKSPVEMLQSKDPRATWFAQVRR